MTADPLKAVRDKQIRAMLRRLGAEAGLTYEISHANHLHILRDGHRIASTGTTHSDRRAFLQLRADLRRAGLDL